MVSLLDGKKKASEIKEKLRVKIKKLPRCPFLAIILVGENQASQIYVKRKMEDALELGVKCQLFHFPASLEEKKLLDLIDELNHDDGVDGIIVQLPLPPQIDARKVAQIIDKNKDVDGFHPYNVGALSLQLDGLESCTPKGIMELLADLNLDFSRLNVVIVGHSDIVGKPMAQMLLAKNATVTVCHKYTKNLADYLKLADLLIVAIGVPNFIKGDDLKKGVIIVDVGINRVDGKIYGDVDFKSVQNKASYITKVPGGVGPMTRIVLFENLLRIYERKI